MIIECPKCHKKYEVEEMYIPIGGGPVRCPNCQNIFGIYVEPMDIPMTEVIEDNESSAPAAKGPFTTPEIGETSFSPEYSPQEEVPPPVQTENVADQLNDLGSFSSSVPETEPAFSQNSEPAEAEASFGNISFEPSKSAPQEEHKPAFSQSMDDFGVPPSFAQPVSQTDNDSIVSPSFAQPAQQKNAPQEDSFGIPPAFAQPAQQKPAEPAMPDFGANPFTQPAVKPTQPESFGVPPAFAQPTPPVMEPSPVSSAPKPSPQQSAPAGHIKAGGAMFDVLLAGFTLPSNYSTMPENMQKIHKDAVKLARQLAKDILLYHKDEVEKGMANGNIKESMKDEIEKSYKFYTQRIQPEIIANSNYFNEALNKIVAKGQKMF
ncbi:MAG: zinc-ribbon domain-containing protein [bacterium]|nr:zinc-ribbon domain-containing protein [bacterium]